MTDEKKIFIVEQETFSEYYLLGIFTTREKADEYARGYNLIHDLLPSISAKVVGLELGLSKVLCEETERRE